MDTKQQFKRRSFLRVIFLLLVASCVLFVIIKRTGFSPAPRAGTPAHAVFNAKILEGAETEASLSELARKYPDQPLVFEKLGDVYSKEKKWDEAVINYERAGELNPENSVPFNKAGEACYLRGNLQKAAECWAQSVVIDPNQAESRLNLARAYYLQGRPNEAFIQLKEVLKIDPENKEAVKLLEQVTNKRRPKPGSTMK